MGLSTVPSVGNKAVLCEPPGGLRGASVKPGVSYMFVLWLGSLCGASVLNLVK